MLIQICTKISLWFVRKKLIEIELYDWCIYWLQKRILTILTILLMFLLGSFTFGVDVTACFLLGLIPLRRRLIGFHTDSPSSCILLSVGVVMLTLLLHSTFTKTISLVFGILNFIGSYVLVVYFLKEMPDTKLGLTEAEIHENHKFAVQLLLAESVIGACIALFLCSAECWSACQLGIAVVIISSLFCKWK